MAGLISLNLRQILKRTWGMTLVTGFVPCKSFNFPAGCLICTWCQSANWDQSDSGSRAVVLTETPAFSCTCGPSGQGAVWGAVRVSRLWHNPGSRILVRVVRSNTGVGFGCCRALGSCLTQGCPPEPQVCLQTGTTMQEVCICCCFKTGFSVLQ